MVEKAQAQTEFAERQTTWFRALQWMLIALLAATAFLTGDGPAVAEGMTTWLVLGFTLIGSFWGVYQILCPPVRFYRQWPAFLLSLSIVAMLIAVFGNSGDGDFRASVNSWWQWVAFAIGFILINQLFHTEKVARGIIAVMVAIAVALSCIGIYDSLVKIPELRSEYFAGSARQRVEMLQNAGISDTRVGSPGRYHFESRIQSPEPHVTFALTNSLAGFLAPWFTLLLLTTLTPGQRLTRKKEIPKLLVLIGIVAFCLVLTKSRSACCAVAFSVLLAGIFLKSYRPVAIKATVVLGGIGCVVFALGVLTHRLDTKILTEAVKSLSFRMEYWESSRAMATDNFWIGVGPGNFRDHYTLYKEVAASESIADPHNWPLEILTNFGILTLLLICGVFATAYHRFTVLAHQTGEGEVNERQFASRFPDLSANQIYLAGAAGCLLGLLIDQLSYALIPLSVFYVALPIFVMVIFLLQDWVDRGALNRFHLLVAFICWLLNLMVAGGISYPGVAFSGWLLLGLAISTWQVPFKPQEQVPMPKTQRWTTLAIMVSLPLLAFATSHRPTTASDYQLMNARFYLSQNQTNQAAKHLQQSIKDDPYGIDAYILYANVLFMKLGPSADEELLREYQTLVSQTLMLNSKSQMNFELFSQQSLLLYQYHQLPDALDRALDYAMRESELYPANAYIWARLAVCQYYAGHLDEMEASIERAFSLDAENPHSEFKLSNRRLSEADFAGWKGRRIYFEKMNESAEQCLHHLRKKSKQQ
ncbi:MAG: O-antigen ligase family protein [Pirellulaceae bacterium]